MIVHQSVSGPRVQRLLHCRCRQATHLFIHWWRRNLLRLSVSYQLPAQVSRWKQYYWYCRLFCLWFFDGCTSLVTVWWVPDLW